MESTIAQLSGLLVLCWFVGYTTGMCFRFVKQLFERATRTG